MKSEAEIGENFEVQVGLHQGSALSPILFIILMDVLTEVVRREPPWDMLFADDVELAGKSNQELEGHLERWREVLEGHGLRVSRQKTQYMECRNSGNIAQGSITMQDQDLEKVEEFKYLGSVVSEDGSMQKEIGHRIQAGWRNWKKCSGVLCDKRVPVKLKGKVYKSVVRPAMLYGAETWATTKGDEKRLEVQEMKMLRWMMGVTKKDKIENRLVRGSVGVQNIAKKVTERRLSWAGHVWRRKEEEGHLGRRMLDMDLPGTRRRGRPKTRWKDAVERDLNWTGLTQEDSGDRGRWRRSLHHHCGDPTTSGKS